MADSDEDWGDWPCSDSVDFVEYTVQGPRRSEIFISSATVEFFYLESGKV